MVRMIGLVVLEDFSNLYDYTKLLHFSFKSNSLSSSASERKFFQLNVSFKCKTFENIHSPPSLVLQEELKVSTKAVTLSNHLGRARMEENSRLENKPTQVATPMVFSAEVTKEKQPEEMRKEEKKTKGGLFHKSDAGSRGQGEKTGASHGPAAVGDDRSKAGGWFGSKEPKDSPQKPRSVKWGCGHPAVLQLPGLCTVLPRWDESGANASSTLHL